MIKEADSDKMLNSIIKLQSHVRTYLARKEMKLKLRMVSAH